ncbi:MAG: TylF/MycF/NovP-related O-methyltransferase [Candidatus Promineifilaceae bacterium]
MFRGFYGVPTDHRRRAFGFMLDTLAQIFPRVYTNDNLIAINRVAGFLEDERFSTAFNRHAQTKQEKTLAWRLHTLVWAANQALQVSGDFVECGVFRGFCSAVITDYLTFETVDKQLYLYDTFTGIPDEMNSEQHSNRGYHQALHGNPDTVYQHVKTKFDCYENVHVVRGMVPDSFHMACPERIAFLHLDMNTVASEIAALEVLFDRVSSGGVIVFDDYGQMPHVAQHRAENAYFAKLGYSILELPTGQGLLIKR